MSASLLKRSLQIVEDNIPGGNDKSKKHKQKSDVKGQKNINKRKHPTGEKPVKRLTIDDFKARNLSKKEQETKNLRKLLLLSSKKPNLDEMSKEKIFQRARTNHYVLDVEHKPEPNPESVFTNEDFEKFEREYFS